MRSDRERELHKLGMRRYRERHPNAAREASARFRLLHPYVKKIRIKKDIGPWSSVHSSIKTRCTNPNQDAWYRYGGRGIQCKITFDEVKQLWFRDKAYLMKKPSIDRIDNDGHYEFSNCRFIELSENISRNKGKETSTSARKTCVAVLLHDIEFYKSAIEKSVLLFKYSNPINQFYHLLTRSSHSRRITPTMGNFVKHTPILQEAA